MNLPINENTLFEGVITACSLSLLYPITTIGLSNG